MQRYKVTALLFPQSDMTTEVYVYADSPEDARHVCERVYPQLIFKEAVPCT